MLNKMITDIVTFDDIFSRSMKDLDSIGFNGNFNKSIDRRFSDDFDMYEEEDGSLVLEIPVVGFKKEEISLLIKNFNNYDKVIISCSKKEKQENKNRKFYNRIINNSSIEKSISLPFKIDNKNVKASVEEGILKIIAIKQKKTEDQIEIKIE
jgi:HSP20 family molecular chaperone IbpA